jgi:hypothetical protein
VSLSSWVRALLVGDRIAERLRRAEITYVERLLSSFVYAADRDAVTTAAYNRQTQYLPGSAVHRRGLFSWEEAAVGTPPFPPDGHVLLGGAGGGRELAALCERGYAVTAFEPAPALVQGAREVARRFPAATMVQASYKDLARHVAGVRTPFGELLDQGFDAVILGYGSLSNVVEADDRLALLRAVRSIAPSAPVLASYNLQFGAVRDGIPGRLIQFVRLVLAKAGVPMPDLVPGLGFSSYYGFRYVFEEGEIERLAAAAGYRVHRIKAQEQPHAVLTPHLRPPF